VPPTPHQHGHGITPNCRTGTLGSDHKGKWASDQVLDEATRLDKYRFAVKQNGWPSGTGQGHQARSTAKKTRFSKQGGPPLCPSRFSLPLKGARGITRPDPKASIKPTQKPWYVAASAWAHPQQYGPGAARPFGLVRKSFKWHQTPVVPAASHRDCRPPFRPRTRHRLMPKFCPPGRCRPAGPALLAHRDDILPEPWLCGTIRIGVAQRFRPRPWPAPEARPR